VVTEWSKPIDERPRGGRRTRLLTGQRMGVHVERER
jgi:hypothetical protein